MSGRVDDDRSRRSGEVEHFGQVSWMLDAPEQGSLRRCLFMTLGELFAFAAPQALPLAVLAALLGSAALRDRDAAVRRGAADRARRALCRRGLSGLLHVRGLVDGPAGLSGHPAAADRRRRHRRRNGRPDGSGASPSARFWLCRRGARQFGVGGGRGGALVMIHRLSPAV
jgi:hypothetical protein